jgi:biopolymer transport protein ExbD
VSVAMIATMSQMSWLTWPFTFFDPTHPRMELPVASNANVCSDLPTDEVLSWSQEDGWIAMGVGEIPDDKLEAYLRDCMEKNTPGRQPVVRVRIPADAPARHMVYVTNCMERAGVRNFRVSVHSFEIF